MTPAEVFPARRVHVTPFGWVVLGAVAGALVAAAMHDPAGLGVLASGGVIGVGVGAAMGRGFQGGTRVDWARWEGRSGRGFAVGMLGMGGWWLTWGLLEPDAMLSVGGVAALVLGPVMHSTVTAEEAENVAAARQHEDGVW